MCDILRPLAYISLPLSRKLLGVFPHASETVCPRGTVLSISSHRKSELKGRLELIMVLFYWWGRENQKDKVTTIMWWSSLHQNPGLLLPSAVFSLWSSSTSQVTFFCSNESDRSAHESGGIASLTATCALRLLRQRNADVRVLPDPCTVVGSRTSSGKFYTSGPWWKLYPTIWWIPPHASYVLQSLFQHFPH